LAALQPVVPAFCTRAEAEKMANIYLERVRQQLQGKMRIGTPSVNQLVYVGGTINNGWLEVPGLPRSMFIFSGDASAIRQYSIRVNAHWLWPLISSSFVLVSER